MSTDIKERAKRLNEYRQDNHNFPLSYCEKFIVEWEQAVERLSSNVAEVWKFEKSNRESNLVSEFDNFDVRR